MSIEQYQLEINAIKSNPEYMALLSKHRGDLDQKHLNTFRLRIKKLEARMASLKTEPAKSAVRKPTGPIRHPVNPALARIASEPLPGARKQERVIIKKSKMVPNRKNHTQLVESSEVDEFINGPSDPNDSSNQDEKFDTLDLMFDDEL
jgi:hypothetical protein